MTPVSSEESQGLLRTILERQAYRQIKSVDVLGHALRFVPELTAKAALASEIEHGSRLFLEVRSLYNQLGWRGLDSIVREKIGRTPYPESRFEFELSRLLFRHAVDVGMAAYEQSQCRELGAIARSYRELVATDPLESEQTLIEYCSDPRHRPQAREWLARWMGVGLRAIGRPGTAGDERAVALGLRVGSVADVQRDYLAAVAPFLAECGLAIPSSASMGATLATSAVAPAVA